MRGCLAKKKKKTVANLQKAFAQSVRGEWTSQSHKAVMFSCCVSTSQF